MQKCLNAQGRMFSQPLVVRGELIGRSTHVLRIGHLDAAAHEAHGESDAGISASVSREVRGVVMAERAEVPRLFPDLHRLDHIHLALVDEHFIEDRGLTDDVLRCALAWVGCAEPGSRKDGLPREWRGAQ